jgi:hypothetical protein
MALQASQSISAQFRFAVTPLLWLHPSTTTACTLWTSSVVQLSGQFGVCLLVLLFLSGLADWRSRPGTCVQAPGRRGGAAHISEACVAGQRCCHHRLRVERRDRSLGCVLSAAPLLLTAWIEGPGGARRAWILIGLASTNAARRRHPSGARCAWLPCGLASVSAARPRRPSGARYAWPPCWLASASFMRHRCPSKSGSVWLLCGLASIAPQGGGAQASRGALHASSMGPLTNRHNRRSGMS